MTISNPDPDDEDGLCTVIISVLQMYRRELKPKGLDNLAIGFAVYAVSISFWWWVKKTLLRWKKQ